MISESSSIHAVAHHVRHVHARGLRPSTIYQRRRALIRLGAFIEKPVLHATEADVAEYLTTLERPETRATELSHLRGFYRWALTEGYVTTDPTIRLVRPRLPRRMPRPMPDEDVAFAFTNAPRRRIRPAILLAGLAGLRSFDMAGLDVKDLWWHHDPPIIFLPDQKGGGQATVPIGEELARLLGECDLPAGGWLFPRFDGKPGPSRPWTICCSVNTWLHDNGIPHTLHTLRHWFVTEAYRLSGGDLLATAELARHRDLASTRGYTKLCPTLGASIVGQLRTPDVAAAS